MLPIKKGMLVSLAENQELDNGFHQGRIDCAFDIMSPLDTPLINDLPDDEYVLSMMCNNKIQRYKEIKERASEG